MLHNMVDWIEFSDGKEQQTDSRKEIMGNKKMKKEEIRRQNEERYPEEKNKVAVNHIFLLLQYKELGVR